MLSAARGLRTGLWMKITPGTFINIIAFRISFKKESGAFSGKMMLVGIVENNKIDGYFRVG